MDSWLWTLRPPSTNARGSAFTMPCLPDGAPVPASYHPARHCWTVAAWSPVGGRRHPPEETLIGSGVDELAAVTDLAMTLEERPRTEAFEEIERRGRLAYLAGAEAESRRPGRPLTDAELERVTGRSPRG